jgi:hypothetical protein
MQQPPCPAAHSKLSPSTTTHFSLQHSKDPHPFTLLVQMANSKYSKQFYFHNSSNPSSKLILSLLHIQVSDSEAQADTSQCVDGEVES